MVEIKIDVVLVYLIFFYLCFLKRLVWYREGIVGKLVLVVFMEVNFKRVMFGWFYIREGVEVKSDVR